MLSHAWRPALGTQPVLDGCYPALTVVLFQGGGVGGQRGEPTCKGQS